MKRILAIIGYIWAILCLIVLLATFIGNHSFATRLAKLDFMRVNPIYSGGETDRKFEHKGLYVEINKPVFAALIGESSRGFVQVKWVSEKALPEEIIDTIDFDNNGKPDFTIKIDTKTGNTGFTSLDKNILGLRVSAKVKNSWLVRVELKNPAK